MNIFTKQNRLTDIESRSVFDKVGGGMWEGWIVSLQWADANCPLQDDGQQGPSEQHGDPYSTSCDKPQWKRTEEERMYA